MKDEIKEILLYLQQFAEETKDYAKYGVEISQKDTIKLLDYITNLQEEVEVSQANEEIYRLEMQDITKILGLDEHTIFDEVKEYATNLQEENERLKQLCDKYEEEHSTTFEYWKQLVKEDYKSRNEKAIEYIKSYKNDYVPYELSDYNIRELLNILNGDDEDE